MRFSALFHPECAPVALDGAFHYVVFSTLQWKTPNLDVMARAAKQRFAVLYNQPLGHSLLMKTLEQAHIQGAMSGVKLVAVHNDLLYIFLSNDVASSTFPAIEALWSPIRKLVLNRRLDIVFACENEVFSGRSDYAFWPAVKEVFESNVLGIEQYPVPVLHDCSDEMFNDDDSGSHTFHVDIRKSFTSQPAALTQLCPMAVESVDSMVGHANYPMTECYLCPVHKSQTS